MEVGACNNICVLNAFTLVRIFEKSTDISRSQPISICIIPVLRRGCELDDVVDAIDCSFVICFVSR